MDIKILIIEDDLHIGNAIRVFLLEEGYFACLCSDGLKAMEALYETDYSLIILDIMLPNMSGQEILKELRKTKDTPVLMITALEGERSQLEAFDNLVDDYVTKPFSIQVLLKRVEALLRRAGSLRKEINIGRLTLYTESYRLMYEQRDIQLTLKEFEILLLLAKNKGKVMSHEAILLKIWGYDYEGDESTLHTHIKNLRGKLPVNVIKTVRGKGYGIEETSCES